MDEDIKVNQKRLPVIIGEKGSTKKELEEKTNTTLDIDSHTGDIIITSTDFYNIHLAKKIILAISRGFSPHDAYLLLEDNYELEVINVTEYVKNTKDRLIQIKGRVIGTEGKIKNLIEEKTNSKISVFGKTVAIISDYQNIKLAYDAVIKLLNGSKHNVLFRMFKVNQKDIDSKNFTQENKEIDDIDF